VYAGLRCGEVDECSSRKKKKKQATREKEQAAKIKVNGRSNRR